MQYKISIDFLVVIVSISNKLINAQSSDVSFPKDTAAYEGTECKTSGGLKGVCRSLVNCPGVSLLLITRTDLCSFVQRTPIYCCAIMVNQDIKPVGLTGAHISEEYRSKLSDDPYISPEILFDDDEYLKHWGKLRPAAKICERYYPSNVLPQRPFVGGQPSLVDSHPHMAAIGWTSSDGKVEWKCGGSVITAKFIITAAHCTDYNGKIPDIARTGDLNLLVTENNTFPEDFKITVVYVHPGYSKSLEYHDIALLKISPDFKKLPICLWNLPEFPVKEMLGMGYGTTQYGGPFSNELFEGSLSILSHEDCKRSVPSGPTLPNGIITGQFCAIDPNHEKDTCQGDSGGPLQFVNMSGLNYRTVLGGITSFGQYCAGSQPAVYTKVSSYLDWIEPIILSDFE